MASALIKKLRGQHVEILDSFNYLNSYLSGSIVADVNTPKYLAKMKAALQGHLKLEDTKLYPPLYRITDKEVQQTAHKFFNDMLEISKRVNEFFDTYSKFTAEELKSSGALKNDLARIIRIVSLRIDVEENTLYPLYEAEIGAK